jgi:hypothetical protein
MTDLAILVRCDGPASELAQSMVDRLDFDRRRDFGPGLVVRRNYPDGGFTLHVEDHRSAEAPWSGYDVALTGDFGDEMLAWELLDEFVVLGKPVALRSEGRILRALLADPAALSPLTGEPVRPQPDDGRQAAYARIMADPDADEPRLSYADLADGLHGMLIQQQIEFVHDRRRYNYWDSHRLHRLNELEEQVRPRIVPPALRDLVPDFRLRRGFPDQITMSAADYPAVASTLAAEVPLQSLVLTEAPPGSLQQLATIPELARLRAIALPRFKGIGDADLATLAASPYLTGLRWLSVEATDVTEAGVEALAAAGTTPDLRFVWADDKLGLNPEACYDHMGMHVWTNSATLARQLSERYPSAAWLQRGDQDLDGKAYEDV